jgi:hypothetical protein
MVLNLLTFLQPCRALSSTLCDARRPYNASFFNGDLTILRDDRDRQVDLRIVIVLKKIRGRDDCLIAERNGGVITREREEGGGGEKGVGEEAGGEAGREALSLKRRGISYELPDLELYIDDN